MSHLTDAEIVDLLEGTLPAMRSEHLDECPTCQRQADDARAMLAAVADVDGPAPSPLFWEQFPTRVRQAIHAEPRSGNRRSWTMGGWNPAFGWATAASLAMLLMLAGLWRSTGVPPADVAVPPHVQADAPALVVDDLDEDEAWAVVRSAARDLAWEEVVAEGLAVQPGDAEQAIGELSGAERAELARLLQEELKRNGA